MFPLLHQKMQVYTSEQCWRHFVALCGLCGVPAEPVDPPPSTCRAERALVKVLRNLSLRHLLLLFQRSALRRELEVHAWGACGSAPPRSASVPYASFRVAQMR